MAQLDNERMTALKARCGHMLKTSGFKISTVQGKRAVHAFWIGAMEMAQEQPAYVGLCLLSGRYEDLVTMPKE